METPDEPSWEDRGERLSDPVRPYVIGYVIGSGDNMNGPLGDRARNGPPGGPASLPGPAGSSAPGLLRPAAPPEPGTALLPAGPADGHRGPGGTGRHRALTAASPKWSPALALYRLSIAVGAALVIAVLAGGVLLLILPGNPATVLAGKCQPGNCQLIAPQAPGTALPVTAPSSASAYRTVPAALPWATPAEATTSRAAAATTATATPTSPITATPPVTPSPAPSVTPTQTSPSPSPTPTASGLTPGSWISIRATTACCTSFYIRHDDGDNLVVITQITAGSSATTKADATWIVQAGLANSSCISFESANDPGKYLRHYDFELHLDPDNGSSQFALDATFCPQPGNSGKGYSFQSVNYPDKYIRHYDYVVYIASDGGSNRWDNSTLWPDDTTWLVSQPWG
jgi:Alpha-L-arabinofuranosidase B (ABFB) domain